MLLLNPFSCSLFFHFDSYCKFNLFYTKESTQITDTITDFTELSNYKSAI